MLAQIHTNRTSHTAADREAAPGGLRRLLELYRLTFLYINSGGNQDRTARFKVSSPAPFLCPEKKVQLSGCIRYVYIDICKSL
jgi:hypothetical protein